MKKYNLTIKEISKRLKPSMEIILKNGSKYLVASEAKYVNNDYVFEAIYKDSKILVSIKELYNNELVKEDTDGLFDEEYQNICWNCGKEINSLIDKKCPKCKWYICMSCSACKKTCSPNMRSKSLDTYFGL